MSRLDRVTASRRLMPLVLLFVSMTALSLLWWVTQTVEVRAIANETNLAAELVAARLETDLDTRVNLVRHMERHWEAGQIQDEDSFRRHAQLIQEHFPGIVALNWVDRDGVIRWTVPREPNRAAQGRNLTRHPVAGAILKRALETDSLQSTPPLTLYQGGRGFAVYVPITRHGRHEGYVNAAFRVAPLVDRSIASSVRRDFDVKIMDEDLAVFADSSGGGAAAPRFATKRTIMAGSRRWTLVLTPKPLFLAAHGTKNDEIILGFAALFAVGTTFMSWRLLAGHDKLAKNETRFRGIVNDIPDFFCRFTPDTTLTFVNQEYAKYFGRSPEELIGTSFLELVPEAERSEYVDHVASLVQSGSVSTREIKVVAADGSARWQRWRSRALLGEDGTVDELQSIGVDVTEAKRAEMALRRSEQKLRAIFSSVSEGIAIFDERGRVTDVNDRMCELTGYPRESLMAKDATEVILSEPALAGASVVPWLRRIAEGQDTELPCWRAVHKNGRPWWSEIDVRSVEVDGEDRFVAVVRDVTARKRLEEQLRHAQKLQAVGTLAAGVAHDFNNVITAVLGFSETAYELSDDRPDARFALDGIRQACEQAAGVTKSLLTFSRTAAMDKRTLELCSVVKGCIRLLRQMLPAAVEIRGEVPSEEEIWVFADESQIRQVIVNLAINARDAVPSGGTIGVTVRPASRGRVCRAVEEVDGCDGSVEIIVTDDGPGMSDEVRARAIEPFFTTKPREKGTGLGLSVVHGIVAEHGGEMLIESSHEAGTSVKILLPCCSSPQVEPALPRIGRSVSGQGETVLVVEDNEHVRTVIARTLTRTGYRVVEAADGMEGMKLLREQKDRVGLVILDIDLPRRSGTDCLDEIRKGDPYTPAILISGLPGQATAASDDPSTVFIQKPFQVADLASVVTELLSSSPAPSA